MYIRCIHADTKKSTTVIGIQGIYTARVVHAARDRVLQVRLTLFDGTGLDFLGYSVAARPGFSVLLVLHSRRGCISMHYSIRVATGDQAYMHLWITTLSTRISPPPLNPYSGWR